MWDSVDECGFAALTDGGPWEYGEMRGGANIVGHAGEFYHFFHSMQIIAGVLVYYVGCYTFDARMRVSRLTRLPLLHGSIEEMTRPWKSRVPIAACFPCGCIRDKDTWLLSYGWLASTLRLASIPDTELQDALFPLR